MKPNWPSAVVALGFLGLVGLMFWRAVDADFVKIWAAVGTVVGVVVGAIPSYFFKAQADDAKSRADDAQRQALEAGQRAERYAAAAAPERGTQIAAEALSPPQPGAPR